MSEFEISVHDIVPALLPYSREFLDDKTQELLPKTGRVTHAILHIFCDDEDDEEAPSVMVITFENGERVMCFSLEGPEDAKISLLMPVVREGEILAEDILFTIKKYADRTDLKQLHEDLIAAGKTRGTPHPHKIN